MQSVSGNSTQAQQSPAGQEGKQGQDGPDGKALEARLDSALTRLEQAAITATQPDPELMSELESLKGEVARLETENLKMRGAVEQADGALGATVERLKAHLAG
ncbi:MAG: hypothetical protein KAI73_00290 [Rhodospirillaceae bacterium]|nr:hypothetical protein [Rhodospirillaceae bacterium]